MASGGSFYFAEHQPTMNTDTPETDSAYIQRPNEGAWDFRVRQEKTMEKLERERDEAREKIEFSREWSAAIADIADDLRSELAAVTEQRDRLAKAIITHRAKAFPLTGEDFDQELWEALQSLTPKP